MTLEEAKDILEYSDKDYFMETLYETYHQSNVKRFEKAIDTVLKALEEYEKQLDLDYVRDNYIPKEKVREKIKELGKDIPMMTPRYFDWDSSEVIKLLEELLGEE